MVSPQKIRYNNIFSDTGLGDLNVILDVAFDSDNGTMSSYLNRSAISSESHDGRYKNTTRYKYDELFSPQFTIVKKDFSDFSQEEVRKLLKYLTSTDKPALLEVYYDGTSSKVDWACIGGWTNIEMYKLANNRTVGIVATFEAITPYAMSDLKTITKVISSPTDNKIIINIDTDDNKPVYPRITIDHGYDDTPHTIVRIPDGTIYTATTDMVPNTVYFNGATYYWKSSGVASATTQPYNWDIIRMSGDYKSSDIVEKNTLYYYDKNKTYYWIEPYYFHKQDGGNAPTLATTSVKFTNTHNKNVLPSVIIKNNNSTERIILDGANKIVSSSSVRRIFGDDFSWNWLELYDGENEITVEGNCKITLEWRTIIKCGEY